MLTRTPRWALDDHGGPDVSITVAWPQGLATEDAPAPGVAHLMEHVLAEDAEIDGIGVRSVLFDAGVEVVANTFAFHTELTMLVHPDDLKYQLPLLQQVLALWMDPAPEIATDVVVDRALHSITAEVTARQATTPTTPLGWASVASSYAPTVPAGHDGFADLAVLRGPDRYAALARHWNAAAHSTRVVTLATPQPSAAIDQLCATIDHALPHQSPTQPPNLLTTPRSLDNPWNGPTSVDGCVLNLSHPHATSDIDPALAAVVAHVLTLHGHYRWRTGAFGPWTGPDATYLWTIGTDNAPTLTGQVLSIDTAIQLVATRWASLQQRSDLRTRLLARGILFDFDVETITRRLATLSPDDVSVALTHVDHAPSATLRWANTTRQVA